MGLGRAGGHRQPWRLRPHPARQALRREARVLRSGHQRALRAPRHRAGRRRHPHGDGVPDGRLRRGGRSRTTPARCSVPPPPGAQQGGRAPAEQEGQADRPSREIFELLAPHYQCDYDETQAIGRRYRCQDEIGTPLCVTVDFDTLDDHAVTICATRWRRCGCPSPRSSPPAGRSSTTQGRRRGRGRGIRVRATSAAWRGRGGGGDEGGFVGSSGVPDLGRPRGLRRRGRAPTRRRHRAGAARRAFTRWSSGSSLVRNPSCDQASPPTAPTSSPMSCCGRWCRSHRTPGRAADPPRPRARRPGRGDRCPAPGPAGRGAAARRGGRLLGPPAPPTRWVCWRFHRLHHTIETMDWLAPNRRHPRRHGLRQAARWWPRWSCWGSRCRRSPPTSPSSASRGLLVHANVRLDAGPVTWLVATPEFHHWHHADHPEAINKNYAGQLPLVDWLFGSLYLQAPLADPLRLRRAAAGRLPGPARLALFTRARCGQRPVEPTPVTTSPSPVASRSRSSRKAGRRWRSWRGALARRCARASRRRRAR